MHGQNTNRFVVKMRLQLSKTSCI